MTLLQLGSEFVVPLTILAMLYVGAEEVEFCIDLRMIFSENVKEMRLQIAK